MLAQTTTHRLHRSAIALLLSSGLALSACDRHDPADEAIQAASIKLQAISGGSAAPGVNQALRKDTYQSVLTGVKSFTDSGTAAQQAAAQLLVARAQAGMGEIAAQDAADLERSFLSTLGVARARLDQWLSQNSVSTALKVYDPAKDLADLDRQIQARGSEAETLKAEQAKVRAQIADLAARAKQADDDARAKRQQEAGIRKQGDGQSQTQRLTLLEQSAAVGREADALDQQNAILQAQGAKLDPVAAEIDRQIARLATQQDLLRKAKADASGLAQRKGVASDAARQEALVAAKTIDDVLKELADQRQAISGPTSDAVKNYAAAAASAKKAVGGSTDKSKNSAQMSAASYSQGLGDVRAGQGRSLSAYIGVLELMASATPALPAKASIQSTLDAARAEHTAASEESKAAYRLALEGFKSGAGRSDEEKKLAEQIQARLERLSDEKPPAAEPAAAPAPTGEPASPGEAAAPMGDVEPEVRAAIAAMKGDMQSGDAARMLAHLHIPNAAARPVLESMFADSGVAADFDNACREKFGKGLQELIDASQAESIKNNPMAKQLATGLSKAGGASVLGDMDKMLGEGTTLRVVKPGEVELTATGVSEGLTLVKNADTADAWKINVDVPADQLPMLQMMGGMMKPMLGTLKAVAADIRADKYKTGDDMLVDLSAKIMGAMMSPGGRPGGRPGGGPGTPPAGAP